MDRLSALPIDYNGLIIGLNKLTAPLPLPITMPMPFAGPTNQ
jgi:hypothetical protein